MAKINLPPSTFVKAAWHNPKDKVLTIQLGNKVYQYGNIDRHKMYRARKELAAGGSVGKWYNRLVKGKHPVTGKVSAFE